jgi:hypothetical protein
MALKFIVRAIRQDKSVELLADESVEYGKQKEILHKNADNAEYAELQMFVLEPHTRAFRPTPAAEPAKSKKK